MLNLDNIISGLPANEVLNTSKMHLNSFMKAQKPALPELLDLGEFEKEIYLFVLENWPATPLDVAMEMKEETKSREDKRRASTKYAYYLKKLVEKKLLLSKKAGNSIIVWPLMVEKYRTIHNILKHHEIQHIAAINTHKKEERPENERKMHEPEYELDKATKIMGVQ